MEPSNITVFTVITGDKDALLESPYPGVAYTDAPHISTTWMIGEAYDKFTDPRRNSRLHKILASKHVRTEYSIYIDGNIRLLEDPKTLIAKYLKNHDIAVYKHPTRDCLYEEAQVCAVKHLDDPDLIIKQATAYENDDFPKHAGLAECGIIFRRHTPKVEAFENEWWAQFCMYSRRDQISFMYAADKTGIRVNVIPDFFIDKTPQHAVKQSGNAEIVLHTHYV